MDKWSTYLFTIPKMPFILHPCEGAQSVQALLKNKGLGIDTK